VIVKSNTTNPRIGEIQAANSSVSVAAVYDIEIRRVGDHRALRRSRRQKPNHLFPPDKNSTTARVTSATAAARSSPEDVDPIE
jgi:hypothetical protein